MAALVSLAFVSNLPVMAQQTTRPIAGLGPTEISVSMVVIDVIEINELDDSFFIDFVIVGTWKDERLAWEGEGEKSRMVYQLGEVWGPQAIVMNERDLKTEFAEEFEVEPDGTVRYMQRYIGRLSTVLDLKDFPTDTQRLPIELVSVRYSPQELLINVNPDNVSMLESAELSGWEISLAGWTTDTLTLDEHRTYPRITFYVEAHRETGYFLLTIIIPLTLITFMAWMVFWIDPNFLPSQVGLSTAAVFSLIAYRTALRLALPKVAYMTKADVFILGATVLVFGALASAIATGRLAKTDREALAKKLDKWGRWVYVVLFVLLVALAASW